MKTCLSQCQELLPLSIILQARFWSSSPFQLSLIFFHLSKTFFHFAWDCTYSGKNVVCDPFVLASYPISLLPSSSFLSFQLVHDALQYFLYVSYLVSSGLLSLVVSFSILSLRFLLAFTPPSSPFVISFLFSPLFLPPYTLSYLFPS
ncbi:hypothetical protein B0T20DRAFT_271475 [Sordaria brevicollis]|uniref:Uncharacterized protein n=1 Tax=Sordaria brevicollis TaxID=83679 RepID=A0AAE0PAM1_SORBR|nr:hypothetical protein B0T20DRAFT_271475 [Sordaria brevicollis]